MKSSTYKLLRRNRILARSRWPLSQHATAQLRYFTDEFMFSISTGDLILLEESWYVTHTGLLRLARRKRCRGIHVEAVDSLCDSATSRYVLKATVYPSKESAGFVGYGDADPSNVSLMVRGAEMRIAETQAAVRALPGLLSLFLLWVAFLAWRPQAFGVLPDLCQGALKEELDLLIRRAVLPIRKFCDPRFQAGSDSDKYGNAGFVHLQITKNFTC